MTDYYFNFCGLLLKISSFYELSLVSLKQHLPGITGVSQSLEHARTFDYYVELKRSSDLLIVSSTNLIYHHTDAQTIKQDFPHLLYCVLKKVVFEHTEKLFIHSIGLKNWLLIGHSGAGKTELAQHAIEKKVDVWSLDKTAITLNNFFEAHAGTDLLSCRSSIPGEPALLETGDRFLYKGDYFDYPFLSPKLIENIAFIKVTQGPLIHKKLDPTSQLHSLLPFVIDCTKDICWVAQGELCYQNRFSSEQYSAIYKNLKYCLTRLNQIWFLEGKKEEILEFISNRS